MQMLISDIKAIAEKCILFFPGQYPLTLGTAHGELTSSLQKQSNSLKSHGDVCSEQHQDSVLKIQSPADTFDGRQECQFIKTSPLTQLHKNKPLQSTEAKTTSFQRRNLNKRTNEKMLW